MPTSSRGTRGDLLSYVIVTVLVLALLAGTLAVVREPLRLMLKSTFAISAL